MTTYRDLIDADTDTLHATASRDLATICGRGVRQGERVTVKESYLEHRWTITAPGGRRIPHVTWEQVTDRTEVQ